jgi:TPR repeat protein
MRHYTKLLHALLMTLLMLVAIAEAAHAGTLEDGEGAYSRGDYATAYRLFRPLANQGVADAQVNLGLMYHNGEGVPQNSAEAMSWFRMAADQGLAEAQYNLGIMYQAGEGVPQNYADAAKWYRKAAEQGYAPAQFNLGVSYRHGTGVPQTPPRRLRGTERPQTRALPRRSTISV